MSPWSSDRCLVDSGHPLYLRCALKKGHEGLHTNLTRETSWKRSKSRFVKEVLDD